MLYLEEKVTRHESMTKRTVKIEESIWNGVIGHGNTTDS